MTCGFYIVTAGRLKWLCHEGGNSVALGLLRLPAAAGRCDWRVVAGLRLRAVADCYGLPVAKATSQSG